MPIANGRILGNYVTRSLIGKGGMSTVWAAEHRFLGDPVAIKILGATHAGDRFLAEAMQTREIDHPNVVKVLDFGRAEDDGALYLVMERLEGEDLRTRLSRSGPLDEADARRIFAAIADGLCAAHARGIVHRDLKPANILLLEDGTPKIVDFGIAARSTSDGSERIGTREYMAPEQFTGTTIQPSTDMFALGVSLFESLTGELPFTGYENGAYPQLSEPARRAGDLVPLSPALDTLITQCLRPNPAERPSSMSALRDLLRGTTRAERVTEPVAPPLAARPPTPPRRRRWPIFAAATAALLIGAWQLFPRATTAPATATPAPPSAPVPVPVVEPQPEPAPAPPPPTTTAPRPKKRPAADRSKPKPAPARSPIYREPLD